MADFKSTSVQNTLNITDVRKKDNTYTKFRDWLLNI